MRSEIPKIEKCTIQKRELHSKNPTHGRVVRKKERKNSNIIQRQKEKERNTEG